MVRNRLPKINESSNYEIMKKAATMLANVLVVYGFEDLKVMGANFQIFEKISPLNPHLLAGLIGEGIGYHRGGEGGFRKNHFLI